MADSIRSFVAAEKSIKIKSEVDVYTCDHMDFTELFSKADKQAKLSMRLTSHRLFLWSPEKNNKTFEWHLKDVKGYECEYRLIWFKSCPYKLELEMKNGSKYKIKKMDRSDITETI
jgi:hypothetical protein